ncbi:MalY/PatB family protein [Buchananella hordeovulneris]|uniref:MalY/PatB family protein n=1 Tax=Buchananella hordeovulneris TaxID=52770 RepID=UPI000F602948|nr:aminotransferase class I/II-fold pyridoxal phosphate-dependent enzyme [Buchananella hordeovulneris]RRD42284.1 aminotransferase class I/II-fold pyridoxal phosphate-dependent enzyme [Buchananella hordeovulneris]
MGFDDVSIDQRRADASLKWSRHPQALGAWVAEMDFPTPDVVRQAVTQQLAASHLGYPTPADKATLVAATVEHLATQHAWQVAPEAVFVTPDVLSLFTLTIAQLTRPGSAVVVPTPAYFPFLTLPALHGREVIEVPSAADAAGRYRLDLAGIEAALAAGAGLVVLCNPWNPVARVLERAELSALADLVNRYDALVFADEIHAPLVLPHAPRHVPYASLPTAAPHTIAAYSATKAWNMPALKCAQGVVVDAQLRARLLPWQDPLAALHSPLGASATVAAYRHAQPWLTELTSYLARGADIWQQTLADHPLMRPVSLEGTYLAWLDCRALATRLPAATSVQDFFLHQAGVDVIDGRACGRDFGPYVRVNLATSHALVTQMADRLRAAADSLQ